MQLMMDQGGLFYRFVHLVFQVYIKIYYVQSFDLINTHTFKERKDSYSFVVSYFRKLASTKTEDAVNWRPFR